jgi:hypothetical protein
MHRRAVVFALLGLPTAGSNGRARASQPEPPWTPLFNGRDLEGWDTWLGKPHTSTHVAGLSRSGEGEYTGAVGLNRDPAGVFSVVAIDGAPAIRVSGEIYGGFITRAEHENYHLRFEFKWGERRWPPREQAPRDTGCCYHSVGPHDASYGFWMKSFEFQIQEGDCGDFHSLAGVIVDAAAVPRHPGDAKTEFDYRPGVARVAGITRRIVKNGDFEKSRGQWNRMDLYCQGQTSAHVVNGRTNMVLTGLRHRVEGREAPLTRGRIQFQSEAAEVFYRHIAIRPIDAIPARVLA